MPFWMLRIVPLGCPDTFKPNASFLTKSTTWPTADDTVCKVVPLALVNMIKSPGLICVLSVGSVMQTGSNVTELPSAAIFPPQPGLAGGPAVGARYTGFESSVLFAASRIVVSA